MRMYLAEDQDNVLDLMPNSQYVETWRERGKWKAPSQCRREINVLTSYTLIKALVHGPQKCQQHG